MKIVRRPINVFNLSFLDVVSVGFGAVILLLILVRVSEPSVVKEQSQDLRGRFAVLQDEITAVEREIPEIDHMIEVRNQELARILDRLESLTVERGALESQARAASQAEAAQGTIEAQLASARQTLTAEMERLLGSRFRRAVDDAVIGGIPVDSEYIIFIIDTSGSMHEGAWPLVMRKVEEVLRIYPQVNGLQVMSDMGDYMFSQYSGRWIPDSPARRRAVITRMASWVPFSNSSPVEGIERAIRQFVSYDRRVSIYIFGDDFSSGSIETVLRTVERLNFTDKSEQPRVRIHAIGFPTLFAIQGDISVNSVRFAALMRGLAENNGGSFVGLNSRLIKGGL